MTAPASAGGVALGPGAGRRPRSAALAMPWPPPSPTVAHCAALAGLARIPADVLDLVLTSPNYNLGASPSALEHPTARRGSDQDWRGYGDDTDALPEAEYQAQQIAVLAECARVLAPGGSIFYIHTDRLWAGESLSPRRWLERVPGLVVRQQIIWDQGTTHQHNPAYFAPTHEYLFWLTAPGWAGRLPAWAQQGSVLHIPPSRCAWHPAPFPLPLAALCVDVAPAGGWVCDPYCGTGTTGVATLEAGRRFVGFERQARYLAPSRRRLRTYRLPLPLPAEVTIDRAYEGHLSHDF